jgi:predicted DNA-binding protein
MRDNKDKTYSFRDSPQLKNDIDRAAIATDIKNSEFLRWAVRKAIKEVLGNGENGV